MNQPTPTTTIPTSLATTAKATLIGPLSPNSSTQLPLALARVPAGFPSPADDFFEKTIDLNEHLVPHPASTFLMRVEGNSMIGAGIHDGDLLIVDRAEEPADGKIVVASVWGELVVKRLRRNGNLWQLLSENPSYPSISLNDTDSVIWGVVTGIVRKL
ncbi:MAG: translesion error-prone DNA polymerase V autoproteolytic subunit [Chthoniobacterales bacterium]|nr:translesion error-prone DNA polymerase V autoproteolytic subunit [Chthoniobacterales bacterium]